MNLPNKLTLIRVILVPFFIAATLMDFFKFHFFVALLIFILASITDYLDGHLARHKNLVTDFGKFLDPLADKILVMSAFICFVQLGFAGAVVVTIILFREFAVTSIRLVAAAKGKVVAANMWGKVKTVTQMTAIITTLALQGFLDVTQISALSSIFYYISITLIWISAVIAVISGVIYFLQNKKIVLETK